MLFSIKGPDNTDGIFLEHWRTPGKEIWIKKSGQQDIITAGRWKRQQKTELNTGKWSVAYVPCGVKTQVRKSSHQRFITNKTYDLLTVDLNSQSL